MKNLYSPSFVKLIDVMLAGVDEPGPAGALVRDVAAQEMERRSRNS